MKSVSKEVLFSSIGNSLPTTDWFTVTQQQIDQFANCTCDHQFIHVDPKRAATTPFGKTIAHGFLSLSLLSHFAKTFSLVLDNCYMSVNYGMNHVRFISPVKVDSRIRCHAKLIDVKEKRAGQFIITTAVEVEIEGNDKPALVAEWIGMQMVKP